MDCSIWKNNRVQASGRAYFGNERGSVRQRSTVGLFGVFIHGRVTRAVV